MQRLAVGDLDRRGPPHGAGRQQLRLAALEPYLRVRAHLGSRRLARRGFQPGRRGLQPRPAHRPPPRLRTRATWAGRESVGGAATVTLGALKPRGNPLAAGRLGALAKGDTVTVRLGRPAGGRSPRGFGSPGSSAAWLTDLLEESDGAPLRVENDTVFVDCRIGTITCGPGGRSPRSRGRPAPIPGRAGAARSCAYWLHGKGPAPAGNLPVAVHLSPVRVALPIPGADPGEAAPLRLTVGCGAEPASGTVELAAPDAG